MNRRSFFGILGKLCAVGTAMSVSPALLEPIQKVVQQNTMCYYDQMNKAFYFWKGGKWVKWVDEGPTYTLAG